MLEENMYLVPFEHMKTISDFQTDFYRLPHITEYPQSCQPSTSRPTTSVNPCEIDIDDIETPKCYYLLNPTGDLKGTETRMRDFLEKKFLRWRGKIGCEPKSSEIAKYLEKKCSFL